MENPTQKNAGVTTRMNPVDGDPPMQPTAPRVRTSATLIAIVMTLALIGLATEATAHTRQVRSITRTGTPVQIAECMVQLGASRGECEVGTFTGTYPASWDSVPELMPVRDAVHGLTRLGGRWSFEAADGGTGTLTCAALPGQPRVCAEDAQTTLALAVDRSAPGEGARARLAAFAPGLVRAR
jgi:hypothetical protein